MMMKKIEMVSADVFSVCAMMRASRWPTMPNRFFENNFEQAGSRQDARWLSRSRWRVRHAAFTDGTNKYLELPGAPLDGYGVLFGPTVKTDVAVAVSARMNGTRKGRRFSDLRSWLEWAGRLSPCRFRRPKGKLENFQGR